MSQKEILNELKLIRKDIKIISEKIDKLNYSCSRMDNHINFVENTYDTLRQPINIVSNLLTNTYTQKLPEIKNNK